MTQELREHDTGRHRRGVLTVLAPLLVAAVLTGAAVVTVDRAGCDTPGQFVETDRGLELVGGCMAPGGVNLSDGHAADGHPGEGDPAEQRG